MKTTITQQEKNPFLSREEFVISIESESAPTKEAIVTDLGKDSDLTVVERIDTNFGRQTFVAHVTVYDNMEAKSKNMVIPQKIRKKMEEERKAKEAEEKKKAEEEAKAKAEAEAAAKEAAEKPAEETPAADESANEESKPVEETPTEEVKEEEKKE